MHSLRVLLDIWPIRDVRSRLCRDVRPLKEHEEALQAGEVGIDVISILFA